MNWKNSLLITMLCLLSWPSYADIYQRMQQLQKQLQQDAAQTLPDIVRLQQQQTFADKEIQKMVAYLHLQACISLKKNSCAVEQIQLLLALPLTQVQQVELHKLASQLYYQLGQYQNCINQAQIWLQQTEPLPANALTITAETNAAIHALISYSHYKLAQPQSAIEAMQQALRHNVTESRQQFLLALYQQQQQVKDERQLLQLMVGSYPKQSQYWERLGQNWYQTGHEQQALNVLSSAYKAKLLPTRSIPLLAKLLLLQQAPQRAATILQQHQSELQQHPAFLPLLTQAYLMSQQRQQALALMQQYPAQTKQSLALASQLAFSLEQWRNAQQLLQQQIKAEPTNQYWRYLLGLSYFEDKQPQLALETLATITETRLLPAVKQWQQHIQFLQG